MDITITKEKIIEANQRIAPYVNVTPIVTSKTLDTMANCQIFFKCQNLQKVGAFKARGAANKILQLKGVKGICTHSSGNHAQALAYVGGVMNIPTVVVMPSNSPNVKKSAVKGYGAQIVECGPTLKHREEATQKLVAERNLTFIHGYNDYDIITGQATCAYQFIKQLDSRNVKLDYIVFPVGGGGLASGTLLSSKYFSPSTKRIGVQPEMAQDAYLSLKEGKIHPQLPPVSIADGLRTSTGEITFKILRDNIDQIILITEQEIIDATRLFFQRTKMVVEPSSATVLAGILKDDRFRNKKVGAIISGGNVDLSGFFTSLEKTYGSQKPKL